MPSRLFWDLFRLRLRAFKIHHLAPFFDISLKSFITAETSENWESLAPIQPKKPRSATLKEVPVPI